MVIRVCHKSKGDNHLNVCIIFIHVSAHGTNLASAAMCGMKIVPVGTDSKGNINIEELRKATEVIRDNLSALTVTYLSTHGVYEEGIDEICRIIHENRGRVYMDGANMNAQVKGGFDKSGFHRSRCLSSESPQDLLYPIWRGWTWHGSYWCQEALGTLSDFTSCDIYWRHPSP